MDLTKAYVPARYTAKGRLCMGVICFLIVSLAGGNHILGVYSETLFARTISNTEINQGYASVNVINVKNARGDEKHAQVDVLIAAPKNPESSKNTNQNLQFARVESRTLMSRDFIGEQGEKMWAGQSKQFDEQLFIQKSVGTMERVLQEREPPQPPKPKLDRGPPAQHD